MKYKIIIPILAGVVLSGFFLFLNAQTPDQTYEPVDTIPGFSRAPGATTPPISASRSPIRTMTPRPSVTTTPKPSGKVITQTVPFTAQAPFGEWADQRQQDGCEEASALMAVSWARGETFTLQQAKEKILTIADWEQETYNNYRDTSAADTVDRIFKAYFKFDDVRLEYNIDADDIIDELEDGKVVVIPADGTLLGNPNFTPPGPEHHMLLIIGYDYGTEEFITNDPGTRQGKNYRYHKLTLQNSIADYPTGAHLPRTGVKTAMIVVSK